MSDLNRYVSGLTVPKLNQGSLVSIAIPVPPLEEQERIVSRLDSMRLKTSEMVAAYDAKLQAAIDFRQSILDSAFSGAL
jgi:type I restriction enzyme S subunit